MRVCKRVWGLELFEDELELLEVSGRGVGFGLCQIIPTTPVPFLLFS